MVNTAEILIRAVDDGASVTLKALVAQFDSLTTSAQRTGESMTSGLTKVNTSAPQAEITHLKEIVDRLPVAAETAASGTTAGLSRISTATSAAEIERLRLLVTQLPASAVDAAGGVDTAMNRITALEARTNLKVLDDALKMLPGTAMSAATETTRSLATVKTQQPEGELTRLRAVITQLDPAAVEAAGGVDAAMKRVTTIEAQTNVKALDSQIKGLITAGDAAGTGATAGLSRLSVALPEAEITRLQELVAKLPEDAVTAAGGANAALNRIVVLEAKANVAALDKEIATLPETSAAAAVGVNAEVDGLKWAESKNAVTEWGTNLVDWAKKGAEAVGLIAVAEGGIDFAAIKTAATYQTTLTENRNNTIMTDQDAANMRSTTLGLAPTLGIDPNVLAQAFRQAFDLNNNAAVTDMILKQSGMSAKSTGDNPEATATILAQLLHEYGLDKGGPNQEAIVTQVMGQEHITAASGKMTLPDFSQNFGQISAWGANLGIPMDQLMADFAVMTAHGFDPATAATQVKDIMPHLIKPTKQSSGEAMSLDALLQQGGFDDSLMPGEVNTNPNPDGNPMGRIEALFSAESLSKNGLSGTFAILHDSFEKLGLDEAQQTEAIMKLIPNIRGGAAAFTSLGQGADDYKKILGNLDNQTLTMNVTQESFNRTQETLGFKWDALKEKLQVVGIELGDRLLPKVEQLTDWLAAKLPGAVDAATKDWKVFTDALSGNWGDAQGNSPIVSFLGTLGLTIRNQVIPAFNDMKGILGGAFAVLQGGTKFIQDHTVAAAALVTVLTGIGTAVAIYKAVQIATEAWTVAQTLLDVALNANPISLIVIGVAALAAGIIYAYTHSDRFRSIVDQLGLSVKLLAGWIKDALGVVLPWIGDRFNEVGTMAHTLETVFGKIFGKGGSIGGFFDDLGTNANALFGPGGTIGSFFDNVGTKAHLLESVALLIFGKGGTIGTAFSDLGTLAHDLFGPGGTVGTFFDNLGSVFQRAEALAKSIFGSGGTIGSFFDNVGSVAHDWFAPGGKIGGFFDNLTSIFTRAEKMAHDIFGPGGSIGGFFDNIGGVAHDWFGPGGKIGSFFDNIGSAAHAIEETLRGIFGPGGTIGTFFDNVGSKIHDLLGPLQDILDKIGQIPGVGAIGNFLGGGGSSITYGSNYGGSATYGGSSGGSSGSNIVPYGSHGAYWDGYKEVYYADGGWLNEMVVGRGMASGKQYTFGESGAELILNQSQVRHLSGGKSSGGGDTTIIHVHVAGSITTARGLAADVRTELLRMQRQGIDLGFN